MKSNVHVDNTLRTLGSSMYTCTLMDVHAIGQCTHVQYQILYPHGQYIKIFILFLYPSLLDIKPDLR